MRFRNKPYYRIPESMTSTDLPKWLHEALSFPVIEPTRRTVELALNGGGSSLRRMSALLSEAAAEDYLEDMAQHAHQITARHFGRTISLYAPLYLSNFCPGGCAYCGFASDRTQPRHRLEPDEIEKECKALGNCGFDDILLLTGEETPQADYNYLRESVLACSRHFHAVSVESFAMTQQQYAGLAEAGCTGVTLYQETYNPDLYSRMHRWGPKRDFIFRLGAPESAAKAGMRFVGIGALLGLGDPVRESLCLLNHALHLRRACWKSGVMISFPRLRDETGNFTPPCPVDDRKLAQIIFAFRICMPDVPLVLSTREPPLFRDNMAGNGISRMSVASRTTVGGYAETVSEPGQFAVSDNRSVSDFCSALATRGIQPVFKNWDRALT